MGAKVSAGRDRVGELDVKRLQSDEGSLRGCWTTMSESWHWTSPSPALVQSTRVPHSSHSYLLPS